MIEPREEVQVHAAPADCRPAFACVLLRRVHASPRAPLRAFVHANAYGCLNVVVQGEVHCGGQRLPDRFVTGPFSAPVETAVEGELVSASLVVEPWLLPALCGVRAGGLVDRLVDVGSFDGGGLAPVCEGLAQAARAGDCAALWPALVPLAAGRPPVLALDVLRREGVEAAAASLGWSSRHYRRRFADALGHAPAVWLRVTRWEEAVRALAAQQAKPEAIAQLAADQGYADQAHLTRETRSFVASTPGRLRAGLKAGEGYWSLRPADVRIVQDGGVPHA